MAGRKQHYIPRCLLKGFEAPSRGKTIKVYVFKRDTPPYLSPILDVAAKRHFYSEQAQDGSITLDDQITQYENGLEVLLSKLRCAAPGRVKDAAIPAEIITHLTIRGAHFRDVFGLGMHRLIEGAIDLFADEKRLRKFLGINGDVIPTLLQEEIEKQLFLSGSVASITGLPKPVLMQVAHTLIRENFGGFYKENSPVFSVVFSEFLSKTDAMARDGHNKGLASGLKPERRVSVLSQLIWTIYEMPEGSLILPDCVALSTQEGSDKLEPYVVVGSDKIAAVLFPLCSSRLVVGAKNIGQIPDPKTFNEAAAACSHSFFVGANKADELVGLSEKIGERSTTTVLDAVTTALGKISVKTPEIKQRPDYMTAHIEEAISSEAVSETVEGCAGSLESENTQEIHFSVNFIGCADQETAQKIASIVKIIVSELGQRLPLSRLDHITFANDYCAAVKSLDRGFPASNPLIPTDGEEGVGVAMAPLILRDGVPKVCVVMHGWLGHDLMAEDRNVQMVSVHALVDQLAHVACADFIEKAMPGLLLTRIEDYWDSCLYRYMHEAWTGYIAARISADFNPAVGRDYRETLLTLLEKAKVDIPCERLAYRDHGDLHRFLETVIEKIGKLMIWTGKLLGHLDGLSETICEEEEALLQVVKEIGLQGWVTFFREDLNCIFERRGLWESVQELLALNKHLERVLWQFGVFPWRNEEGQVRVEIPLISDAAQLLKEEG